MIKDAKVAVVGGRGFTDYPRMKAALDEYREKYGISIIVSGGATGADTLAENYAKTFEIDIHIFMAKWKLYGQRAGPRRNLLIAEYSDVMFAFPDANSVGTFNAITLMKRFEKPVYFYEYIPTESIF